MPKEILPVAARLNALRHKRRLAVAQVAERTGLGRDSLHHWERLSGPYPRIDKLAVLAQFYGVSVDYLIGLTDNPEPHYVVTTER